MLLIYAGVRAVSAIVEWRQWDSLRFGEYGEDSAYDVQWRAVAALAIIALQCHFLPFQCFTLFCWQLCNTKAVTSNIFVLYIYICEIHNHGFRQSSVSPGEPVQCTAWLGQCILYILIMMFEKVLIMLVLLIPQWKQVSRRVCFFVHDHTIHVR